MINNEEWDFIATCNFQIICVPIICHNVSYFSGYPQMLVSYVKGSKPQNE
jgi:hypothetical protein